MSQLAEGQVAIGLALRQDLGLLQAQHEADLPWLMHKDFGMNESSLMLSLQHSQTEALLPHLLRSSIPGVRLDPISTRSASFHSTYLLYQKELTDGFEIYKSRANRPLSSHFTSLRLVDNSPVFELILLKTPLISPSYCSEPNHRNGPTMGTPSRGADRPILGLENDLEKNQRAYAGEICV